MRFCLERICDGGSKRELVVFKNSFALIWRGWMLGIFQSRNTLQRREKEVFTVIGCHVIWLDFTRIWITNEHILIPQLIFAQYSAIIFHFNQSSFLHLIALSFYFELLLNPSRKRWYVGGYAERNIYISRMHIAMALIRWCVSLKPVNNWKHKGLVSRCADASGVHIPIPEAF